MVEREVNGGKSWLGVEWLITSCYLYPGTKWFIGRNELSRLMKSSYITFLKVCKHHGIPAQDWKHNGQHNYIEFKNGSRIDLLDLAYKPSDPMYERFGSTEYTSGWIEEAGEVPFGAFDVLKSRIGRHLNKKYGIIGKMYLTFNPSKNWLYRDIYKKNKEGKLPENYAFIQSLYMDNPHTAEDYGKNLEEITDVATKKRLMYGEWEYESGDNVLIKYDSILDLWTNQVPEVYDRYITADIARYGQDKTVIYVWKGFQIVEMYSYEKQSLMVTAEIIRDLSVKEHIPYSHIIIDEDGVGCLTEGTQVMTTNGWVKAEDIKVGDELFSKNINNIVTKETVTRNRKRGIEENTEVIELDNGYKFSFSHFLPHKTRKEYPFKLSSWDDISSKDRIILDNEFNWEGKSFDFTIPAVIGEMPNGGKKVYLEEKVINGKSFAKFLGWFISEGYFDKTHIGIAQGKDSRHLKNIEDTLDECGFKYYKKEHNHEYFYIFSNKNLKKWLSDNCYTNDKHISLSKKVPNIIKDSDKETITAFLQSFNEGDGYVHHGEMCYTTSSKQLSEDLLELILKKGRHGNIRIKHLKGSKGTIHGREITRTADNYVVYENKGDNIGLRSDITKRYPDEVYDIGITGETRLFMVKFEDGRAFWVHNGGVIDFLVGVKGFVNNSSPLVNPENRNKENYQNLKTQCIYILARYINQHKIAIAVEDLKFKEFLIEELEQVKSKDSDKDGKLKLIPKDEIKELIGRSPDYSDAMMMRMYYELDPPQSGRVHTYRPSIKRQL